MRILGDPPGEGDKKKKKGKIVRSHSYGRNAEGKRTAKVDLDTGEKGLDSVWSDEEGAWQVPSSSAKEGQQFDIKESAEITADKDRSKTPAKGMGLMPAGMKASEPSPVTEKKVNLKKDIARSMPLAPSNSTNQKKVSFPSGGAHDVAFVPIAWRDFPTSFKSQADFEKAEAEYRRKMDEPEENRKMRVNKENWVNMRLANKLSTDETAWQAHKSKYYDR